MNVLPGQMVHSFITLFTCVALLFACDSENKNKSPTEPPPTTTPGCIDKVAAFFLLTKGSYTSSAFTFDNTTLFPTVPPKAVGFNKGQIYTVTVNENCTLTVDKLTLTYKEGTYAEFPGTGANAGKTQYNVDMTGTGLKSATFERFINDKRGVSLIDLDQSTLGVRFDE